ncbi:hypothetical protein A0H81_12449 [Grifola frondosa]|uniref:Uncharacterized protein n=1 Tax=Grifola frondosa TaxID=5627 RepID=A0A1C7LXL7_GRIFR|nr:hypothetical protein A0H81_12449 [Grifola frondosa]
MAIRTSEDNLLFLPYIMIRQDFPGFSYILQGHIIVLDGCISSAIVTRKGTQYPGMRDTAEALHLNCI